MNNRMLRGSLFVNDEGNLARIDWINARLLRGVVPAREPRTIDLGLKGNSRV